MVLKEDRAVELPTVTRDLKGARTQDLRFRLSRRALAVLRRERVAWVSVAAEQIVGSGIRATSGGFGGDALRLGRR